MNLHSKDREPYLHLPPGYHAHLDPDVLVLSRADGSRVALFSSRGFVAKVVEQAAWEDYGGVVVPEGTLPAPVAPLSLLRHL
jgi:hypothetical protein